MNDASPEFGTALLRLLGALCLVLALFGITAWLLKRSHRLFRKNQNHELSLLESLPVAPRQSVLVVQYRSRKFLLAASPQAVAFLCRIDEEPPDLHPGLPPPNDRFSTVNC